MRPIRRRLSIVLALGGVLFLWRGMSTVYFWANPAAPGTVWNSPAAGEDPPPDGTYLGRMTIPRLHVIRPIVAGTSETSLLAGPGLMAGTPMPGQPGNSVIAGHRDTHFHALKDIEIGDIIVIERRAGRLTFEVTETRVVEPNDVSVLKGSLESNLTLITCYPFRFIGAAPQRFIVKAKLSAFEPKGDAKPEESTTLDVSAWVAMRR